MSNSINPTSGPSNSGDVQTKGIKGFFKKIISIISKPFKIFIPKKSGMVGKSMESRTTELTTKRVSATIQENEIQSNSTTSSENTTTSTAVAAKPATKQQERASTTITTTEAKPTTEQVSATIQENETQLNPTTSSELTTPTAVDAEEVETTEKQTSTQDKALTTIVEQIFKGEPINISKSVRSLNVSPAEIAALEKLQGLTRELKSEEDIFKRCFLYGQTLMFGLSETILKGTIYPKIEPTEIQSIFLEILDKKLWIAEECTRTPFFHRKSSLRRAYLKFKKKHFNFDFDGYCNQLKKTDKEKMKFFLILGLMKTIYQDLQKYSLHSPSTAS